MNYLFAPCGNEKIRNDLLNMLFEEIGCIYGRNSKEGNRKKGMYYIASKVPNGKLCHVKNMDYMRKN